jgi:hypothetical protein
MASPKYAGAIVFQAFFLMRALSAASHPSFLSELRKGAQVRVRRSSGEIEDGWQLAGFNPDTGDAIVQKIEGSKELVKQVS